MWETIVHWIAGTRADDLADLVFELNTPLGTQFGMIAILCAGIAVVWLYRTRLNRLKPSSRWMALALRTASVLVLLLLLFDPCLTGIRIKPSDRTVALLFDDSASMKILSSNTQSRGDRLIEVYQRESEKFLERLRQKFQVVTYRFGDGIERLSSIENLDFNQPVSDIDGAIQETVQEWEGNHLSAVILFSDGIQQPLRPDRQSIGDSPRVPVYTVGTDTDSQWRDLSIENVSIKRTPFDLSPIIFNASLQATGFAGKQVAVDVLESTRVIETKRVEIETKDSAIPVQLRVTPSRPGWTEYTMRVRLEEKEPVQDSASAPVPARSGSDRVKENNSRRFVMDNRSKEYRILYVSGRPNWEHSFVRRALLEDDQLKMSSLIRISAAERKFVYRGARTSMTNPLFEGFDNDREKYGRYDEPVYMRLGVKESELADGFPSKAEDLFSYHAIVFGDVERDFFTLEQLDQVREFVSKRGGSLLVLGGPRAFTEGGFSGTPIENMLPVQMGLPGETLDEETLQEPFQTRSTIDGERSGAWPLDTDPETSRLRWEMMPSLFGLNAFTLTRAGATVWARTRSRNPEMDGFPLFAIQRYGQGRCAVLAAGETWPWRMKSKQSPFAHERIWRQIIRSLVMDTPKPIVLRGKEDAYPTSQPIRFGITVRDEQFNAMEGLQTGVSLIAPSGETVPLPVDESIQETGLYTCEFVPIEAGTHRLTIRAADAQGKPVGELEDAVMVEPDRREWLHPRSNPERLKTIARKTGGEFVPLERMAELVGQIPWIPTQESERARIHLWYHPGFFFLLPLLMAVEWLIRRRGGLA